VKLVNALFQIEDNYQFPISLLLYWGFSWEADEDEFFAGKRELTTAGNIPKPIQTGFEMLANLGEERLLLESPANNSRLGILPTRSQDKTISLIAYNYEEADLDTEKGDSLFLDISGLKANTAYEIMETSMDQTNNNTYSTWEKMGRPPTSRNIDLGPLEKAGSLKPTGQQSFRTDSRGSVELGFLLHRHSMVLMQITESNTTRE
jgi:hypothetical protein